MKNKLPLICSILALLFVVTLAPLSALINPQMQPRHQYEIYNTVFLATVTLVDARNRTVEFSIEDFAKGNLDYETVVMTGEESARIREVLELSVGRQIVGFAGRNRPASARQRVLYYIGGGTWHEARMGDTDNPDQWKLIGNPDSGVDAGSADIMFGVFNGKTEQLWLHVQDLRDDRAYFPATPFTRFEARKIDELPQPGHGVAIFDVNRNGRLDLLVASEAGSRVYIQNAQGEFEDHSKEYGINEVAARSIALADVDGDGSIDLLLDGVLYLQCDGEWKPTTHLPAFENVVSAAFADITGNGYPDVVVSLKKNGVRIFANSFANATPSSVFAELTADLGLNNLAGHTGRFEIGDWTGNNRTDILYLGGAGYFLLNQPDGFELEPIGREGDDYNYTSASMAPMIHPERNSAFVLLDDTKILLDNDNGKATDITRFGNEIRDDIPGLRIAVVEDFGVDGTLDIYAMSGTRGSPDFFLNNRGYGSFMMPEKYQAGLLPSQIYNNLVKQGAAAGDVTGDGANDLFVSGADGSLWLLVNKTADDRPDQPELGVVADERARIMSRSVTVALERPRGVVNAWVRLLKQESDEVVLARQIGGNLNSGSTGPHQTTLTVREPGNYRLQITYSDGEKHEELVNLGTNGPRHQTLRIN